MSVGALVARGRRSAEALMTDTAKVTRITGETTNSVGVVVNTRSTIYTGKAKRQSYQPYEQTPEAGGHTFTIQRYSAHFPVGSFVPEVGDLIEWTSNASDSDMVGLFDRVAALLHKSQATAMRLLVDENVVPPEAEEDES